MGYKVAAYDGFLDVNYGEGVLPAEQALQEIASTTEASAESLLPSSANFITEKFHQYLSPDLLLADAASSRLDLDALPELARSILEE